jgi:putative ABC transport system permease protein
MSMDLLKQSLIILRLNLASLPQRAWPAIIIVLSMTCVVGALLAMLSETAGMLRAYRTDSSPQRALVMEAATGTEFGNSLTRNDVATIFSAPGIARRPDGGLAADAEILFWVPPYAGYLGGSPLLLGLGPAGLSLHPHFALVSGRLFETGRQELIIGVQAARAFRLKVGDKALLPSGEWPIVGIFAAGGGLMESRLVGDAATIMTACKIPGFGSVLVQLDDLQAFAELKQWLTTNPALMVTAERQSDYYLRVADGYSAFFTELAYVVGVLMALGALFGSVKIMHSAISTRTREIATLRAIGYGARAASLAVLFEMIILAITGACCGAAVAWLLFDGRVVSGWYDAVELSVSPRQFLVGLGWALILAILSSIPPAIRAGRLSVANGLVR